MAKNRKQASLTNVVQYDSNFNLSIGSSTSSSFNSSGSIVAASGFTGSLSGSVFGIGSPVSFSSSVSSDLINLESKSASVDISITNINSFTSSNGNTSLNQLTGSLATTGSNTFYGTQTYSGSVYIANDLVVQGSSSIQYISASSVSIGTNIVRLNTANPTIRYAGLTMIDSGSIGGSGSFLYDSVEDEFIFVHRGNGTNVTSSHFILGPETYDNLGNELYLTCNVLTKGTGKEHLIDSCIFDNGTTTCIKNNLVGTGTACFGSSVTATQFITGGTPSNTAGFTNSFYVEGSLPSLTLSNTGTNTGKYTLGVTDGSFGLWNNTTSSYRLFITSCGNVGIGTTTPVGKLDVALLNTRRFIVTYDDSIVTIKGASDTGGGENLRVIGDNLIFNTNSVGSGTERMRITSTGIACFSCQICAPRINVSNTSTVLLVEGTATNGEASINLSGKNSSGTVRDAVFKYDNTDVIRLGTSSNIGMQFETNDVSRFRLTSAGIACFACQVCVGGNVLVGNDINAYLEIANGGSTDGKSGIRWMVGSGRTSYGAIELAASSASNGYLSFSTMNSGTVAERMRITSAGISCFSNTVCAPIVVRCASKWQLNGSVESGGNNSCALVINIDNSRAVRVRGIVTGVSGQTMTSMGMYEAVVYRLGGGAGNESKRFAVLVDCNASPGNGQGIKMDVIGDTLYIQNKSGMSYAQSITAWAEIFYA